MTVQGDLQDVSLSSLIQMLCTDKREAVLLLHHDIAKDGVIFFDNGEIIHARIGNLVGEEALFQLLSWSKGTFRMGHDVRIPRRTVNAPWHYLLLEGMKQLDEQRAAGGLRSAVAVPTLTAAEKTHDQHFEQELIILFSQLEYAHAQLPARPTVTQIWHTTADMVNQIVSFAESYLPAADCALGDMLQISGAMYPVLLHITNHHNRLAGNNLLRLQQTRPEVVHSELVPGIVDLFEALFHRLGSYFYNSKTAAEWEETGQVFLNDFKQMLGSRNL